MLNRISLPIAVPSYKWRAFAAIAVGLFSSVADNGSVVVALPTIADHFNTDLPTTQWVVIAYALTISALLLPMGRLSDMVGRKGVYLLGFGTFTLGAVLAGTSTSAEWLIFARVIMGTGAAMTQGTSMAMLISSFPEKERGKALGLQISVVGTGGVAGPAMGGFIVGALGWRGVFWVTAILGILAILAAQIVLDRKLTSSSESKTRFDWMGATLSTCSMVAFLLTVSNGHRVGWGSPTIVLGLVAVVALVATFIWWELRTETPLIDLRLFGRKLFAFGVAASFISFIGMSSVRFLMPFYLQVVQGYSPQEMGLIIVPAAVTLIVIGPLGGRLSDRYGWRTFNVVGLALSATGLFLLSRANEDSALPLIIGAMVLQSGGLGIFNPPNNSSILSTVDAGRYGVVSGLLNLVRNSGNVTGIAIVTAIVTAVMASKGLPPTLAAVSDSPDSKVASGFTSGLQTAYFVMGSLVLVGIALSFFKGDREPTTEEAPGRGEPG